MNIQLATLGHIIYRKQLPEDFDASLFVGNEKIVTELISGNYEIASLGEICGNALIAKALAESMEIFSTEIGMNILRRQRLKNEIKQIAKNAIAQIENSDPNEIVAEMALKSLELNKEHTQERSKAPLILEDLEEIFLEHTFKDGVVGIPSGYKIIDVCNGGLRQGHLIAISAYTNVGKTTFMMNIVNNIFQKARVVIISLEMSKTDIMAKLIAINQGMMMRDVYNCGMDNRKFEDYTKAKEKIEVSKMAIYSEKHKLDEILAIMRSEDQREHVDVFFIDFLQNITTTSEREYEALTRATKEIQAITSKLKTTTVVLSQISNENRGAKELSINGKGSGSLRACADLFLYLNYQEKDDDILLQKLQEDSIEMEITAVKARFGHLGRQRLIRNSLTGQIFDNTQTHEKY